MQNSASFVWAIIGLMVFGSANACESDINHALQSIIKEHVAYSEQATEYKQLTGPAELRANWCKDSLEGCVDRFSRGINAYLEINVNSAVLIFASKGNKTCSMLFSKSGSPIYQGFELSENKLRKLIEDYTYAVSNPIEKAHGRVARHARMSLLSSGKCSAANIAAKELSIRGLAPVNNYQFDDESLLNLAKLLSRYVFPEVYKETLEGVEHLTIIPFGSLTTLPVATLFPFSDDRKVLDYFSINYLLFAGDIITDINTIKQIDSDEAWKGSFTKPLIIGNPQSKDASRNECMTHLPHAEREAKSVAKIFDAEASVLQSATFGLFAQQALEADLIYFAAHGQAGRANGIEDSFIALADQNLTARDIQELTGFNLKANLVVMSACETGLGAIQNFGVAGLARTFLDAGARNVLMSLWQVDDKATYLLMDSFNELLKSEPPAIALQHAQQALIRNFSKYSDPIFWAGFSVYGRQIRMSPSTH